MEKKSIRGDQTSSKHSDYKDIIERSSAPAHMSCTIMLCRVILLLLLGFSSSSHAINLPVGSKYTLQCLPDSPADLLSPEFSWRFAAGQTGDRVDPKLYSPLNNTESELHLTGVKTDNTGTYECVAKGLMGEGFMKLKRTFVISVKETPLPPLLKFYLIIATEGEVAKLPCKPLVPRVTGYKATWTKEREGSWYQEIKPVTKNVRPSRKEEGKKEKVVTSQIHWAADPKLLDWSIEITGLNLQDGGIYKCEVSKIGSKTKTVLMELVVEKAPPPRCFNQSQAWEKCEDPENRSWKKVVSESMTAFSLHVYEKLNKLQASSNLLFSPLSIARLFSHLLLGSRGEMRQELESALSLPPDFSCIHSVMRKMKEETKDTITMASQMFYNPELTLEEAFRNQSQQFYDSVPVKLTNRSEENVQIINDWVAHKTQNRITELLDTVEESTEFILVNAVYFIGKWRGTFEVQSGTFTTFSGDIVPVQTLYSFNYNLAQNYIPALKAQVARFPLEGKTSLYILVPNHMTKEALTLVENLLTESNVMTMVKDLNSVTPAGTEVTLPMIKLLLNTDLNTLLKKIGLSGLFEQPNLCGMFRREEPVFLTDARHRAFLSLTEKGVEAAAASSVSYSRSFNTFSAMQPFVLMVWNDQINSPVFMGKVIHPLKSQ